MRAGIRLFRANPCPRAPYFRSGVLGCGRGGDQRDACKDEVNTYKEANRPSGRAWELCEDQPTEDEREDPSEYNSASAWSPTLVKATDQADRA